MNWIKIAGVVLLAYLLIHAIGLPWGLLWGCAAAMIVLP